MEKLRQILENQKYKIEICNPTDENRTAILFGYDIFQAATNRGSHPEIIVRPTSGNPYDIINEESSKGVYKVVMMKITGSTKEAVNQSWRFTESKITGASKTKPIQPRRYREEKDDGLTLYVPVRVKIKSNSYLEVVLLAKTSITVEFYDAETVAQLIKVINQ